MRKCGKCGAKIKLHEPDPCLGQFIEGIAFCCCGHDDLRTAYCIGWPNCLPNEGPYKKFKSRKGYFEFRGQEALDYLENQINRKEK